MRIELYIPRKEFKPFKKDYEQKFCGIFNGFTRRKAHGAWKDNQGVVVSEPVYIYTFLVADDNEFETAVTYSWAMCFAGQLRTLCNQDCVLVTIGDKPYFV